MCKGDIGTAVINGAEVTLPEDGTRRLASFLRDDLGLTGTKIGCNQGDCGSCSVLIDGKSTCACLVPVSQVSGARVVTIEGVVDQTRAGKALQNAMTHNQAVQCGFCTPAFIVTAAGLFEQCDHPDEDVIAEELAAVLCRCTGYAKIVKALQDVANDRSVQAIAAPSSGAAVGTPIARLDGTGKVDGTQHFGADGAPADALLARAIRSPHHSANFSIGNLDTYRASNPEITAIFTAADVPGRNLHGVHGAFADQPVFAERDVKFRGEAIAIVVGIAQAIEKLDLAEFPVTWHPRPHQLDTKASTNVDARVLHKSRPGNILIKGHVERGDVDRAFDEAVHVVTGRFSTQFVEHAYIEPEAGWAKCNDDVVVVHSCTQAPHAHRGDIALILGIPDENVWIVPTAVGGGFGGKLDLTTQPYVAIAAWHLRRPVKMIYSRAESIATSTKRHPAEITSRMAADAEGRILAVDFTGDYNTGAFASWGTAVANRVPVHAGGPYYIPHYRALTRAIHTHVTPAGAFRGFGVPQTAIAQEQMIDALARKVGMDQLEFRLKNAIRTGQPLVTGQVLQDSVGIESCLEALREPWRRAHKRADAANATSGRLRRGVGLSAMMYGCGNTAMANPSTIRLGVLPSGDVVLHQGAVDAGQGSNTVIPQIAADALGIPVHQLQNVGAATNITPDCGRTSASRQTFVTGKAAELAGRTLRNEILRLSNGGAAATVRFCDGSIDVVDGDITRSIDLERLPINRFGYVLMAEETFDPITTALGENGQGSPYAVYAFGAQIAEVEVDMELGTVAARHFTAAHDVGRMINPTLLEGQIEGAIAQGIGQALMEEFIPGLTENFHDYLIPTLRDIPPIDVILIEDNASVGPFGAKGIGEPSLVPTASAIFNAIFDAIGVRLYHAPATPDVVLRAIISKNSGAQDVVASPLN